MKRSGYMGFPKKKRIFKRVAAPRITIVSRPGVPDA